jgi:hypothetical protein
MVAGAFDIDAKQGRKFEESLGLEPDRIYSDYQKMVQSESECEEEIKVAGIMTPNSTHHEIVKKFYRKRNSFDPGKTNNNYNSRSTGFNAFGDRERCTLCFHVRIMRLSHDLTGKIHGGSRRVGRSQGGTDRIRSWELRHCS